MNNTSKTTFVPQLVIKSGTMDIEFYKQAFGAIELRRWSNDDGSIHVAEMTIEDAMFHFHEESARSGTFSPEKYNGVTTTIGLMVADVDTVMARALAAGVRLSGCTVHFVRAEMDSGPIIVQAAVPVEENDDDRALADRILAAEHRCYPLAVRLIAEGRVKVDGERVTVTGAIAPDGPFLNPAG